MSSYSEYLGRKMQRTQKFIDTRPHRDAGHHTEILKRVAAAGVQEQKTNATSGNLVLNGPTTRGVLSPYKPTHSVQDVSRYTDYTAGQAVAQSSMPINAKASQIQQVCYSATTMPEFNDRIASDPQLAAVQAAKNTYQRGWNTAACCTVCGKPPQFASGCACSLTVAQQVGLPTSVSRPTVPS
jgi:hypothetical protein